MISKVYIKPGDIIYYDGNFYEAISSYSCVNCIFFDNKRKRCRYGICSRYENTLNEPIVWKFYAPFNPQYLDSVKWVNSEQRIYVYEVYKQQIRDYHLALARELSSDD